MNKVLKIIYIGMRGTVEKAESNYLGDGLKVKDILGQKRGCALLGTKSNNYYSLWSYELEKYQWVLIYSEVRLCP